MAKTRFGQGRGALRRGLVSGPILIVLWLLVLAPPAPAASPIVIHDQLRDEFSDPNFCGSGLVLDVEVDGVQTVRFDSGTVQVTARFRAVLTNPETGAAVIVSAAGQVRNEFVDGDPEGVHTHSVTFTGLPEKIQIAGGEVLLRDAGVIAFVDTFDGDKLIGSQVVLSRGPHPEADADFTLFCTTVLAALA